MDKASMASTNGLPVAHKKKSNAWVWYFVILAVMTVATTTTLIVYNLRQQLTPGQLADAIALWKAHGPHSYDLEFTKEMKVTETYHVEVRNGEVVKVTMDGRPLEERLFSFYSMPALFSFIERFLKIDQQPGQPRAYVRATFDERDGHLHRYVRSVSGKRERVEIVVKAFQNVTP